MKRPVNVVVVEKRRGRKRVADGGWRAMMQDEPPAAIAPASSPPRAPTTQAQPARRILPDLAEAQVEKPAPVAAPLEEEAPKRGRGRPRRQPATEAPTTVIAPDIVRPAPDGDRVVRAVMQRLQQRAEKGDQPGRRRRFGIGRISARGGGAG